MPQRFVYFLQSLFKIANSISNALRPWIIGTVCEPRRDIHATQRIRDGDAIENVVQGFPSNRCVGVSQRSIFIILVLKHIRIDRTGFDSMLFGKVHNFTGVVHSPGEVPLNVQCQSGASTRQRMHLRGIAEFFFDGARGGELDELAESRAGIREAPRRELYPKVIERFPNHLGLLTFHSDLNACLQTNLLGFRKFLRPLFDSAFLRTTVPLIPRPTVPPRKRPLLLCHSNFPAGPPSVWQNCPASRIRSTQESPPALCAPPLSDLIRSFCSLRQQCRAASVSCR